ncbi:MAG TPA: type III pantothenate kinase [Polyangiaceae bacterium LLY-WYZ-14_1]|nr:type III pantothenate kinase [Polyangiaceae bacterium LLY-WYZ-14_1]
MPGRALLLAVDIGNTHTVLGFYEGARLARTFRIESSTRRTTDELQVLLRGLLTSAELRPEDVVSGIVGSVVPALTEGFVDAAEAAFGCELLVVGPGIKTGMPILTDNTREVGPDRILNAVAAFSLVGGPAIVVDFGTATTFDCISGAGEYLGGAIAPGMEIAANALFQRTAMLPRTELVKPPRPIGRNTIHAMQSGIVYGYVGLVDGMVARLRTELGGAAAVLATGGLARLVGPESQTIERIDEHLTLEGLRLLHDRNQR